jgi:hypothetical protein
LDISDPAEKGGLGFVIDFAIKTTIIFASGFSIIPFLYNLSIWISGIGQIIGLLLVVFYLSLITAVFGIPVYYSYTIIKRKRKSLLRNHLYQLAGKYDELINIPNVKIPITQVEINLSTWYIQRLKSIKVLPVDSTTALQFCISIVVPIVITYFQYKAIK